MFATLLFATDVPITRSPFALMLPVAAILPFVSITTLPVVVALPICKPVKFPKLVMLLCAELVTVPATVALLALDTVPVTLAPTILLKPPPSPKNTFALRSP